MRHETRRGDKKEQTPQLNSSDSVGAFLREQRLSRNIGLEEVSEATGITTAMLQALENNDRQQLPAEVYIKAFYKKYAEYLGIDADEIAVKYQQQAPKQKKTGRGASFSTVITLKGKDESLFGESLRRLFMPLVIIILGIILYWIYKNYLVPGSTLGFYRNPLPGLLASLQTCPVRILG